MGRESRQALSMFGVLGLQSQFVWPSLNPPDVVFLVQVQVHL